MDTSALFNMAGMETNRTDANNTFDASVPSNVPVASSDSAAGAAQASSSDPLAEFM